jgi:flagellar protein FliL
MPDVPVLAPAEDPAPSGKGKWLTIVIAVVLVLLSAGVGAWLSQFWVRPTSTPKHEAPKAEPLAPPQYLALDPPFVVNFEAEQLVRFLQVSVQLMSRDSATIELLRANDPVIRNDLLLLFGNQKYSVIATREGKERLRAQALATVRKVIAAQGGKPEKVEAVYFTSFVMQ